MQAPFRADYVMVYFTLFERFQQEQGKHVHYGHPFDYEAKVLIVFFTIMMVRRMTAFKTQHRWLENFPDEAEQLCFSQVPHRTTLSRRFKSLYPTLQAFIAFIGVWASALSPEFDSCALIEDSSLFKGHGPVWHQSDRNAGRIPDKLRNLDTDASWRKSTYHGWVYGYSLHLSCNLSGFPKGFKSKQPAYRKVRFWNKNKQLCLPFSQRSSSVIMPTSKPYASEPGHPKGSSWQPRLRNGRMADMPKPITVLSLNHPSHNG
jgi:hypothetical protein